ncbi:MAG TPA: hypothetical protein DDZ83_15585 [Nitrospinae bacterium]|nr:hypothetical protein [Nitrospinota bacterium]
MEPIVLITNNWGATFNIPWYLFLGGMSGGILIVAAMTELIAGHKPRYHALSGLSALMVLPFMVIGTLALTFHLARPMRGVFFPIFMTNTGSWMAIGGWIIGVFVPVSVAVTAAWYFEIKRAWRLLLAVISLPLGVLMCLYTGYLLSGAMFIPLWSKEFLPLLFLFSGLSTGLAVCAINAYVVNWLPFPPKAQERIRSVHLEETAPILGGFVFLLLLMEIAWMNNFLTTISQEAGRGQYAVAALREGQLRPWFIWGVEVVGIFVPILLSILEPILRKIFKTDKGWVVGWPLFAKLPLVLLGGLLLRHVIIWGGEIKQPLIYPPQMSEIPKVRSQGSPYALSQALRKIHRR